MAGFTTERDLGTEGAGYADVGLRQAIDQGIVPGPRLLVSTKANVARGAYGPKGFEPGVPIPQGAEEISGADEMTRAARDQIAAGADVIKMYADYHYRPSEPSRPTMTEAELAAGVAVAHDAGRLAAAHATTAEGMRRAALAGVDTIEHGYQRHGRRLQADGRRDTSRCVRPSPRRKPTPAISSIGTARSRPPESVEQNRRSFRLAMKAGVPICMGGDVGVFAHGKNWLEMEAMQRAGMAAAAGDDRRHLRQCPHPPAPRSRRGEAGPPRRSRGGRRRPHPRRLGGRACPLRDEGRPDRPAIALQASSASALSSVLEKLSTISR